MLFVDFSSTINTISSTKLAGKLDIGQSSDPDQLWFGRNKPLTHSSRCENIGRGATRTADIRE